MLLIDAANVIGSRPDGWWRDRPGAARAFVAGVRAAAVSGRLPGPVVVVLEGAARRGVGEGRADGVTVVHARGSGDDRLVAEAAGADGAAEAAGADGVDGPVTLVTADRALRQRVAASGARSVGPGWLLERLGGTD